MPKQSPDGLRPYTFIGVDFTGSSNDEWLAECPFCEREGKLSVNEKTAMWRCWNCEKKGNQYDFIREYWALCDKLTTNYDEILKDRKIMFPETAMAWGFVKSFLTGHWMVPGYNWEGNLCCLYKYVRTSKGMRLLPTPNIQEGAFGHYIMGRQLLGNQPTIALCEGPWDGAALYEVLVRTKQTEEGLRPTSNQEASIGAEVAVMAVPGCKTFNPAWSRLFDGRQLWLTFDNDYPREDKSGNVLDPAGLAGCRLINSRIVESGAKLSSSSYVAWGSGIYNADLPEGYDVRDHLVHGHSFANPPLAHRVKQLGSLLERLKPAPSEWTVDVKPKHTPSATETCEDYRRLTTAWRKALRWTEGLDCALSVMLASCISTKIVGDQLWVKIIGPASCGKSTLCEAVSVNKQYVMAKSTIRGFHSGYGGENDEDCSLAASIHGKTLVTKDGDTLLQSPNLGQILAEARDLYDCTARTHYRNKVSRDYDGIRMTWILCGTSSLRSIDSSELGERFLDCVIMDGIDDELEDDILWRVANRANRNLAMEAGKKMETQQDPDMTSAMALTGGYVTYLRENAAKLLAQIENPNHALWYCTRLGKFVAFMRARPSLLQNENAEREFAARLVSQMVRLSKCLAAVLGRTTVDETVLARTRKVAIDTARGQSLEICKLLYENEEGLEVKTISVLTPYSEQDIRKMLQFLRQIEVLKLVAVKKGMTKRKWVLEPKIRKLFQDVGLGSL